MVSLRSWHLCLVLFCISVEYATAIWPFPSSQKHCENSDAVRECRDNLAQLKKLKDDNFARMQENDHTNTMLTDVRIARSNDPAHWLCVDRHEPPYGSFPPIMDRLPRTDQPRSHKPKDTDPDQSSQTPKPTKGPASNATRTPSPSETEHASPTGSSDPCSEYEQCERATRIMEDGLAHEKDLLQQQEAATEVQLETLKKCTPRTTGLERRGHGDASQMRQWQAHIDTCHGLIDDARAYKRYQETARDTMNKVQAEHYKRDDDFQMAVETPRAMERRFDDYVKAKNVELGTCQRNLQNVWEESSRVFDVITAKYETWGTDKMTGPPLFDAPRRPDPGGPKHTKRSSHVHRSEANHGNRHRSIERREFCHNHQELIDSADQMVHVLVTVIQKLFGQMKKASHDRSHFGYVNANCQWYLKDLKAKNAATPAPTQNSSLDKDDQDELSGLRKDKVGQLEKENDRLEKENAQLKKDKDQLQKEKDELEKDKKGREKDKNE